MKKWGGYILCFLFTLFLLFGCSFKDDKNDEDHKDDIKTYVELETQEELVSKIDNDDSFVLLVYASWCSHCAKFKPILSGVVDEKNLTNVYAIESSKIRGVVSLSSIRYIPTLVVYNKGEASVIVSAGSDSSYFSDSSGVENFLDKFAQNLVVNDINVEQLRNKRDNGDSFIIYFEDSSLDSTEYLNNNYMNGLYNVYSQGKEIYSIDLNDYNDIDKQTIRNEFGLSFDGNNQYGYGEGVTPSFQYYNDGILNDMVVYANDEYSESDGSITITNSYYSDNIHIGETMLKSEYYSIVDDFYNSKINSFLSQYLKFVD